MSGELESRAISRAVSEIQMPLIYRKIQPRPSGMATADGAPAMEFNVPSIKPGVLPQTTVQRTSEMNDSGTASAGVSVQRAPAASTPSTPMPLRKAGTTAKSVSATEKPGHITIENPRMRASSRIQRAPTTPWSGAKPSKNGTAKNKMGEHRKRVFIHSEAEKPKEEMKDLDEIARKILPLLKRMLAVERERKPGR